MVISLSYISVCLSNAMYNCVNARLHRSQALTLVSTIRWSIRGFEFNSLTIAYPLSPYKIQYSLHPQLLSSWNKSELFILLFLLWWDFWLFDTSSFMKVLLIQFLSQHTSDAGGYAMRNVYAFMDCVSLMFIVHSSNDVQPYSLSYKLASQIPHRFSCACIYY